MSADIKSSAHISMAASAHKAQRLDVATECYCQSVQWLSVILEPNRMEKERE